MDITEYRESNLEKERTDDLVRLLPNGGHSVLDVGARDGHFSKIFANYFELVTALDLETPNIAGERIYPVAGDVTNLEFSDNSFDLVFCAEVLEHIAPHLLINACNELRRVTKDFLLIGVPYKQDIRVGRTTCYSCGKKNPPWGHVNTFTTKKLKNLFNNFDIVEISLIGNSTTRTNFLSTLLMDYAGNPYGTYEQEEKCIHCDKELGQPPARSFLKKSATKFAFYINNFQKLFHKREPSWIHILLKKSDS